MGVEKDIIIALEFGSSTIRGIAGRKKADGTIQVLGIEQENAQDCVQKGVVYNIDKTTQAITNIIENLNIKLGIRVKKAYVGIAGQSLHTACNFVTRSMEMKVKITPELVDNMMDNNLATQYTDSEILDVIPQEYVVGNHTINDPVGILGDKIEARFMNVVARTSLKGNIEKCMRMAGIEIADTFISPLILADALLSENEKRSGCALVDFGAGTTTISVYNNNLLRHLAVLPLGGNNITNDIVTAKQMEQEESESMKRKHGVAYVTTDTESPRMFAISNDRSLNENELQNIIGARQEEIIDNVWHQIESNRDKMLSGIIITGGGVLMKDITEAIKHHTEFERVKIAKSLVTLTDVCEGVVTPQGNNIDTLIAMIMKGDASCAVEQNIVENEPPVIEETPVEETPIDSLEDEIIEPKPVETTKKPGVGDKLKSFGRMLRSWVEEDEEEDDESRR